MWSCIFFTPSDHIKGEFERERERETAILDGSWDKFRMWRKTTSTYSIYFYYFGSDKADENNFQLCGFQFALWIFHGSQFSRRRKKTKKYEKKKKTRTFFKYLPFRIFHGKIFTTAKKKLFITPEVPFVKKITKKTFTIHFRNSIFNIRTFF